MRFFKKLLCLSLLIIPLIAQGQRLKSSEVIPWELPINNIKATIRVLNITGGPIKVYVTPFQSGETLGAIALTCKVGGVVTFVQVNAGSTAVCTFGSNPATDDLYWVNWDVTRKSKGTYKIE